MKEIRRIIAAYREAKDQGVAMALATVVDVEKSSYRRKGARLLVREDGVLTGGISGGCLEGDALRRAQMTISAGTPRLRVYDTLDGEDRVIGIGLGCNGKITVLFQPLDPEDENNPVERLSGLTDIREPTIFRDEVTLMDGTTFTVEESLRPEMRLLVAGDNYDVLALGEVCRVLGWELHLFGTERKLGREYHRIATTVNGYGAFAGYGFDDHTALLLMTHDYKRDLLLLRQILPQSFAYLGILGPRVRAQKLAGELGTELMDREKVYTPVGLDIGAESPEEIAMAVAAEITAVFRDRPATYLRERKTTIHG